MSISTDQVRKILYDIVDVIEKNKEYLTELDAAIGDSDHGINMARGFSIVKTKLDAGEGADIGGLLQLTAMALISNVGGAAGPLYGTLFLKAAGEMKGKSEMDLADFDRMLVAGIEGVKMRGKAEQGEKTMLDVLIPVEQSIAQDVQAGTPAAEALAKAADVAKACADKTKDIQATKGRASYLGERSIGHIDPGAMSSCLMVGTVASDVRGN